MNQHKSKKQSLFTRKSCVVATEFALAMMAAPLAFGQASPPAVKIEVTGSRIPLQQNVESTSPISVITADDIKIEGIRNTDHLLTNMPQVFSDQGNTVSNGSSGTATVSLRGLGADRTLVLVNGKRLPAGAPDQYATDLNQIPAALIQRVEILTGGASAIYGSDAVAGVVNFIMRKDFQGVQGDVNYGFYNHSQQNPNGVADIVAARAQTNPSQFVVPGDKSSDGESTDVSLIIGDNFANNRGNATVFFGYHKEKELKQSERDYSTCTLGATAAGFNCGGSGTSFPGQFVNLTSGRAYTVADSAGNVRPYVSATDQFNFGPYNFYQRPSERYSFDAYTHYDINNSVRAYMDFGFMDDQTHSQIAPSGVFGQIYTANFENPLLTASWRTALGLAKPGDTTDVLLLRRNVEGGGRIQDLRHTSYRTVVGFKGDVMKNWDYDVYLQEGRVVYENTYLNDFSTTRTLRALDVVAGPGGVATCRSAADGSDPNCVPYNIYRLGGITQDQLAYLQIPLLAHGFTRQSIQGATLSSDLGNYGLKLPGAQNGAGVAFGIERRVEQLDYTTDSAYSSGDGAGQGGPTIGLSGKYTVKDYFAEARLPIIEGAPMADLLSINGSYRYSDYDTGKTTDTYGFGAEWAPIRAVKLRASYQQAVRAANIIELFQAQGTNLYDNAFDPCGPHKTSTFAQCQNTGITAATYGSSLLDNPAGQYNYIQGGNPALKPETAKSYTFGLVFTPDRNLSATIDYYDIKIEDIITNASPVTILNQCLATGNPVFCSSIHRDQLGTLWLTGSYITATNQNLAKWKTKGVDVAVNWNYPFGSGWGGLNLNFIGTYLKEFTQENIPGLGEYDCAGLYGSTCGLPLPEWRHKFRATWSTAWNVDLSGTWRHFDSVKADTTSSAPLLAGTTLDVNKELKAMDYFDLAASWAVNKQFTVRGGINNVFDKDPPLSSLVGTTGNGNTYPQLYDSFGRQVFVSATYKF